VVMSPATAVTFTENFSRSSRAVASSASRPRAVMTRSTPSRASDIAQPLPRPLEAAHTSAVLPRNPRSISRSPSLSFRFQGYEQHAGDDQRRPQPLQAAERLLEAKGARDRGARRAERADERELVRPD